MKINTKQAAERLKVTVAAIRKAAAVGLITDLKPKQEGAKRHYPAFEEAQVKALGRSHVYTRRRWIAKADMKPAELKAVKQTAAVVVTAAPGAGIITRLENLERQVTELLEICTFLKGVWS